MRKDDELLIKFLPKIRHKTLDQQTFDIGLFFVILEMLKLCILKEKKCF
jgi:hypothetical protein